MSELLTYHGWSNPMVLDLCQRMRPTDAAEIYAMRPDMDAWSLYRDLASMGPAHLWFEIGVPKGSISPVVLFAVTLTSPGTGYAHLFASPLFSLPQSREVAARIRTKVIPTMIQAGLHRVEALSLADYRWAHRFMKSTGAKPEGLRRSAGKAGEDFLCFTWLKEDFDD